MGLLEKANAAGDAERNVTADQLKLQFEGVEVGAVQNSHFIQIHSLLAQFEHSLGNECRLLETIVAYYQHRLGALFACRR